MRRKIEGDAQALPAGSDGALVKGVAFLCSAEAWRNPRVRRRGGRVFIIGIAEEVRPRPASPHKPTNNIYHQTPLSASPVNNILFAGFHALCLSLTRGHGDHSASLVVRLTSVLADCPWLLSIHGRVRAARVGESAGDFTAEVESACGGGERIRSIGHMRDETLRPLGTD